MTKRFTAQVPTDILYAIGWMNQASYAEVFDYFADKGIIISISKEYDMADECFTDGYEWCIDNGNTIRSGAYGYGDTWIESATEAILRADELIIKK